MSTEAAKPNGSSRNHGGARPGSGRKPETLSVAQVQKMLRAAKRRAKKEGKTIDDILLNIIYAEDGVVKDVLAAIKLFKDKTMATMGEGGITDRNLAPSLYLPEQRPVLTAVQGGKSA